jgi:CRISPR-associated protein Cmr3
VIGLSMSAIDTLHFRDSTPFAPSLTSPEHHSGQFPPHPTTVVGALRAMFARSRGWQRGPWGQDIKAVLGDGPNLGDLKFDGPYLLRDGEPLYAVPAHVLGVTENGSWRPHTLLRPGAPVLCDLGEAVRLPEPARSPQPGVRLSPGPSHWLTRTGFEAVLRGELPGEKEVVAAKDLWGDEHRVGIQRDNSTRTVLEGMLYTSRHVRPRPDVSLGVHITGLPDDWLPQGDRSMAAPLGGEGRWAEVRRWSGNARCHAPVSENTKDILVVALTPIDADESLIRPGAVIPELADARIVSACLPRAERVGGWASTGGAGRPQPLTDILPAGSTLFCEVDEPKRLATLLTAEPLQIGRRCEWGFGVIAIGLWPDNEESR